MPRYTISQTAAVWVTWTAVIEADSEEDAARSFYEGDHGGETEEAIGDSLDGYDQDMKLEAVDGVKLDVAKDMPFPDYPA